MVERIKSLPPPTQTEATSSTTDQASTAASDADTSLTTISTSSTSLSTKSGASEIRECPRGRGRANQMRANKPKLSDADKLYINMGTPYEAVLLFLWMCQHSLYRVPKPVVSQIQDEATLNWERTSKQQVFPPQQQPIDINGTSTPLPHVASVPLSDSGAAVALSKPSDSLNLYHQGAMKSQAEHDDSRLKSWQRLPKVQQNIILLGGVTDQGSIPSKLTEEMMSILGCQNGAQVDQFLPINV